MNRNERIVRDFIGRVVAVRHDEIVRKLDAMRSG
jgi:hypothetical protein